MSACRFNAYVDAHFARDQSPAREREMRQHLPGCAACTARYQRHLLLARLDPKAPSAEDRLARGLGLGGRSRWRLSLWAGSIGMALAAATLLLVVVRGTGGDGEGFVARGGRRPPPPSPVEAGLTVLRLVAGHAPARIAAGGSVGREDELAFAYTNPRGRHRLMVFAVDEQGRVFWYHPAWERPEENPRAVPIEAGSGWHELGAAIRHPLDGEQLELQALFTDDALDVRAVEARLREAPSAVPCSGCERVSLRLHVTR